MRPRTAGKHGRLISLLIGALALLACLWLGRYAARQALLSYLFAFVFFTGLSIGSLALALVPALTGGEWGRIARPQLQAAIRMLPLQALFSLPLLIGVRVIYPWADPLVLAQDAQLRAQSWYLDPTFFIVRSVIYFGVWFSLGATFGRRAGHPERLSRIAAPGLIAYGITATLASIDWIMSLFPHWHSTIFGLLAAVGWVLASAALATIVALYAMPRNAKIQPGLMGWANLLLALVLAWTYLAFMQYLTVWIADLPAETSWYMPRTLTSWRYSPAGQGARDVPAGLGRKVGDPDRQILHESQVGPGEYQGEEQVGQARESGLYLRVARHRVQGNDGRQGRRRENPSHRCQQAEDG